MAEMQTTKKLKLKKPSGTDFINVKDLTDNFDTIDKNAVILKSKVYDDATTTADGTYWLDMFALNTVIVSAVCEKAFADAADGGVVYLSPVALGTEGMWVLAATDSGTGQPVKSTSLGRVKVWYIDLHEEMAEEGG